MYRKLITIYQVQIYIDSLISTLMCCKQITTVSLIDQNIKSNSAYSINLTHSLQIKTGFAAALDSRGFTSFK